MVVPMGAPGEADVPAGGAGRKGALYTGRGPVCGTIIRGGGATGGAGALGATGLAAMVGACGAGAAGRRVRCSRCRGSGYRPQWRNRRCDGSWRVGITGAAD